MSASTIQLNMNEAVLMPAQNTAQNSGVAETETSFGEMLLEAVQTFSDKISGENPESLLHVNSLHIEDEILMPSINFSQQNSAVLDESAQKMQQEKVGAEFELFQLQNLQDDVDLKTVLELDYLSKISNIIEEKAQKNTIENKIDFENAVFTDNTHVEIDEVQIALFNQAGELALNNQPVLNELSNEQNMSNDNEFESVQANTGFLSQIPAIKVEDRRIGKQPQQESGLESKVTFSKDGALVDVSLLRGENLQNQKIVDGALTKNSQDFSTMLTREIQNNAADFVKTGKIILRDNNSGTITMVLHPEELGNVKIKLDLSDKVITGKITVESAEAYSAFKSNLQTLRTAFLDGGFDSAGFDLSWSGAGNGNNSGSEHKNAQNPGAHFYANALPDASGVQDELNSAALYVGAGFYTQAINVIV